jgi:hypothetical protein
MKKIIFFIVTATFTNLALAQMTLEQSYVSKVFSSINAFNTDSGINYFTVDNLVNQLKIYDANHVLIKTVNVPVDSGHKFSQIFLPTDRLFNSDDLIEMIILTFNSTTYVKKMVLINENGVILQNLGNRTEVMLIKLANGSYKLETRINDINGFDYDIYNLPGTLSVAQVGLFRDSIIAFPNPTQNVINFTSDLMDGEISNLEIFDLSGKMILQKNVITENQRVSIDISDFSTGVYICKLNGKINKFSKK